MKKHVSRLLQPGVIWYCVVLLVFTAAAAALDQYYLAGAELLVTAGVFLISRVRFARRKQELVDYVQSATDSVGVSVHAGSPFPMAVLHLPEAEIIWGNPAFYAITGLADATRYQTMDSVIPDFTTDWLRDGRNELPGDRKIGDRRYRIYGNYVRSSDDETTVMLATIYFADMTEMFNIRDEFVRTRPVVAVVLIDNYDELMNNLSDSAVANLNAQINETVSKWIGGAHALSRKIERNRYLLVFENSALEKLQNGKFSVLESIRTIVNPSGVAATISLGIGKDGASFEENYNYAMLSIEMALSRGGDQAVIKDRYNFTFYGGRTKETERHTKVKSRVVAGSLSELIAQSSEVFLMGHRMADLDAVGAAVGLLIDHHRRAADYIEHAVLSLHELFASSASELVTELLQYALDPRDLRPIEAQALLAGIVLDTKNFSVRTGSRTFEAAAFLRRTGADTVDVKKLFQSDLDATIARYQVVQAARLYRDDIAIAAVDHAVTRTIASQAADELLNISGILTSFVLYPDAGQVVISARSIGSCNVQVVLEPLGGGGNAAAAGAQIKDAEIHDVLEKLVASIDKFYG